MHQRFLSLLLICPPWQYLQSLHSLTWQKKKKKKTHLTSEIISNSIPQKQFCFDWWSPWLIVESQSGCNFRTHSSSFLFSAFFYHPCALGPRTSSPRHWLPFVGCHALLSKNTARLIHVEWVSCTGLITVSSGHLKAKRETSLCLEWSMMEDFNCQQQHVCYLKFQSLYVNYQALKRGLHTTLHQMLGFLLWKHCVYIYSVV